jgi:hypothetical protein
MSPLILEYQSRRPPPSPETHSGNTHSFFGFLSLLMPVIVGLSRIGDDPLEPPLAVFTALGIPFIAFLEAATTRRRSALPLTALALGAMAMAWRICHGASGR